MNGQALSRGQSERMSANDTLYLINQSYPFTVEFSGSATGASSASSSYQRMKKEADDKESQQKALDRNDKKVQPKRNIKDFFVSSPKKVSVDYFLYRLK